MRDGTADTQIPEILADLALLQHPRPEIAPGERRHGDLDLRIGLLKLDKHAPPSAARWAGDHKLAFLFGSGDGLVPLDLAGPPGGIGIGVARQQEQTAQGCYSQPTYQESFGCHNLPRQN
jgi:hypothetical protein